MKKAKFLRKYYGRGYERDFVYLVYEYRKLEARMLKQNMYSIEL